MSITLVTFDLDDTLWDVAPALERAEVAQRQWLETHRPRALAGLDDAGLRELKKRVWREQRGMAHDVGALRRALIDALQRRGDYPEADIAIGTEGAFAAFLRERQRVKLYTAALPALRELAQRYRLIALSNGNADVFRTAAAPFFTHAFNAAQVGASKPAPALFKAALEAYGIAAEVAVHVGDHPDHDIAGAASLGIKTVWFNNRGRCWADIAGAGPAADAEISCLSELPGILTRL